jgi:predicted DNA-binding transcriptional regulator AlpA
MKEAQQPCIRESSADAQTPAPDRQSNFVEPPAMMRAKAAAHLCGISEATWWRWVAAGNVPRGFKIGGTRLWSRAELLAWIDASCPSRRDWEARRGAVK